MIVFGSPEARKVIEKDRKKYGTPDPEHDLDPLHRYYVITSGNKEVESVYVVEAVSEEKAREIWHNGGGELIEEEVAAGADSYDEDIEQIIDKGEVTA